MNLASSIQRDRKALERADKAGVTLWWEKWWKTHRPYLDGLKQKQLERWM
jgi:hypothetical protein